MTRNFVGAEGDFQPKNRLTLVALTVPVAAIKTFVLAGHPRQAFIVPDTVFMTLGSCFANNLAKRLRDSGFQVLSESIGEEVNSTAANRALLHWVANGVVDAPTAAMDRAYGEATRERLRAGIKSADVIVLTMGVAPTFFSRTTGEMAFMHVRSQVTREHFMHDNVMRTTTVTENVENVREVINIIRRISPKTPEIVLTVSPVPLGATTEFGSAVIADCLSKSTLRVACEDVMRSSSGNGVHYWPSFEIVRWLAGYLPQQSYGADDGNTRHVSTWLVRTVVDLFIDWHLAGRVSAA